MEDKWKATDILKMKGSGPLKVRRWRPMGKGNRDKGTEHGVIYWVVLTSPWYHRKTGIDTISMVPETKLKPLK